MKISPHKQNILCLLLGILLITNISTAQSSPKVTYLYNSGWLIETVNEIILIDYVPTEKLILDSILFTKLQQAEVVKKKAYVLITHEHNDHFYEPLLKWHHKIENLTIILGWDYETNDKSILKVFGRNILKAGSLKITSHPSTDVGSGFLINVDDLAIYHAGDHAVWSDELMEKFTDELTFIKNSTKQVDMAFIPIARGKLGACKVMESITKGNMIALQILNPKALFPMHLQCDDLTPYHEFAKRAKKEYPHVATKVPRSYNYEMKP